MRIDPRAIVAAGLAGLLSACTTGDDQHPFVGWGENFGEASRQTLAAQVIDPDPVYDAAVPESSGAHAAQAIERYRTDKVKKPERLRTSDVSGTGSSSGSQ